MQPRWPAPAKTGCRYIRGGGNRLDRSNIFAAVDDSLRRLQTDVIDLYQLHWPERPANYFGQLGYEPARCGRRDSAAGDPAGTRRTGRRRQGPLVGVSNETPWGLMRYLSLAESLGLPRMVSIQNPYSLLNRSYEVGLAEVSHRENVGLLAYSPLGFGVLSGKYLSGTEPCRRPPHAVPGLRPLFKPPGTGGHPRLRDAGT